MKVSAFTKKATGTTFSIIITSLVSPRYLSEASLKLVLNNSLSEASFKDRPGLRPD